jgi:hypothetical protein
VDTSFGVGITLDTDGAARALAGARVGGGTLAADREATEMPDAAVTLDGLEPFEVETDFASQIAFGDVFAFLNGVQDLGELLFVQVLGTDGGIDGGMIQDDPGVGGSDPIDVTERDLDPFVAWNIDTEKTWHKRGTDYP